MGLDTELEFDKYCKVVRNPKVGRISQHRNSKDEVRIERGKSSTRGYLLRDLDDEFTEISFGRSWSSSCKSKANVSDGVVVNETVKRNSVYQGSKEVRKMKKMGSPEGRQKIELSLSNDTALSFRIFDSSQSDMACPIVDQKISTLLSLSEDNDVLSDLSESYTGPDLPDVQELSFRFPSPPASKVARSMTSDGSLNMAKESMHRKDWTSGTIQSSWREPPKFKCDQTIGPLNDGNGLSERDAFFTLHKSSSEKVGIPYSPSRTESDRSNDSPKARFSPFRKFFNPIMKSKSLRSSPVSKADLGDSTMVGSENIMRNRTFRKSLLNDFSKTASKKEPGTGFLKRDHLSEVITSSPAHLNGLLTLELKHGVPYFEFSFKNPDDVLSAKTWRANNAFSWVYTFHSMNSRRTSHSSGWGTRERHKESSIIGQMQVSCFLLSEMRNNGSFDTSTVTEFVLYDIVHAQRAVVADDNSHSSTEKVETTHSMYAENLVAGEMRCESDSHDLINHKRQAGYGSAGDDFDTSTHYPWAPADLHPSLEIAAIVIQVPFEKRESLKEKRGDKLGGEEHQNLFDFSADQKGTSICSGINRANMKVVTPAGAHGLPSKKAGGCPSPLLERWRTGGCCDCGGWDMACPLLVFDNHIDQKKDHQCTENQQPIQLFFQGGKENFPALTITSIAEGKYSVDFHAHLSKLQAFSICVSILHGCEASTAVEQEKNTQNFHCNSLKVLLNEEARFLIEAVADKEKRSLIARA